MKHTHIRRSFAACAVGLALTVTGCAGTGSGQSSQSTASGSSTTSQNDMEFWIFLDPNSPDDPRGAALKSVVEQYNSQTDGPKVSVRSINYAKIDAEVIRAAASGQGPDIVNVYSNQLPMHVAAKSIQPMTKYAEPLLEEYGTDILFPLEGVTYDGEIQAMPWELRVWLLWYRADLLEEAGLNVPQTLDEIGTVASKLQKPGTTGLGVGFSNAGLGASFMEKFIPLTWGEGGEIIKNGEAVFDDVAGVSAMDRFTKWHDQGAFGDETLSLGSDEVISGFKAGSIAMAIEGSYRVEAARAGDGIGENLQTVPLPSATAGTPLSTPVAGQTLAIGANASNPDAAFDFIKFYSSVSSQEEFAAAGVLPTLASTYDSESVKSLANAEELQIWLEYVRDYGRPNPVSANFNELSDSLVTGAQQVIFQGGDATEVLSDVANKFNEKK